MKSSWLRRELWMPLAAGALITAGGFHLVGEVNEVTAREGANGGEIGGRRGRNHRGRDKRHRHGDRKDEKKRQDGDPGGPFGLRGIALEIHNGTGAARKITVRESEGRSRNQIFDKEIQSGETVTVSTSLAGAKAYDFHGRMVVAENLAVAWPAVTIYQYPCEGDCKEITSSYMSINQILTQPGLEVKRLDDDDDHKRFRIDFTQ